MPAAEHVAMKAADLAEGAMRGVEIDGTKLVIARVDGEFHAVDGICPHYGGPLAEGMLCGSRLRCPWHQACFDVRDGKLLEPPALVALKRYEVRQQGDDLVVRFPAQSSPPAASVTQDQRTFVILGHGAAGEAASQSLRESGFAGRIVAINAEATLPYDRPALSKNYLRGTPLDHPLPLQPPEFYVAQQIDRIAGTLTSINFKAATVQLNGQALRYDALLLSPGAKPKTLGVEGEDLRGVFTLRSLADCDAILAAVSSAKRAVIIGSGFIGMEAAASLRERGLEVIVVSPERVPLAAKLGEPIGSMFHQVHLSHGVTFRLQSKVTSFHGDDRLRYVSLDDGTRIDTTLAIVAVGVRPATEFLRGSLPLNDDGSITVDRSMRVAGLPNIFAAGDVARFPSAQTGQMIRIEHWRTAQQLGRVAAFNMAGVARTFDDAPYFWTYQFDVGLDYVGHASKWDDILIDGRLESHDFLAYYLSGDEIAVVSGCNRSQQTCAVAELMRQRKMPGATSLRSGFPDWVSWLKDT